jgi:hypothetical protein
MTPSQKAIAEGADFDSLPRSQQISLKQGGRGVSLQNTTVLTQVGAPLTVGTSPSEGTCCTAYLACNGDAAYNGATVGFYVMSFGREVLLATSTITAAQVAASGIITATIEGCAADLWEVRVTLNNGTTVPALPLQSSVLAYGVENPSSFFYTTTVAAGAVVNQSVVGSGPSANPSFTGTSTFTAAPVAPDSINQVSSQIVSAHSTNATPQTVATIPLPGTTGAPATRGKLWVDCIVRMVSTTSAVGATFKLSWGWNVQTSGSPVADGTAEITAVSVGTNAGAPPAGWAANLVLDGGRLNALIQTTGDPALVVAQSVQYEYSYLQ